MNGIVVEFLHDLIFFSTRHFPVNESHIEMRECLLQKCLHTCGICDVERLGFFHERRDPVDLPSLTDFFLNKSIYFRAFVFLDDLGVDRFSSLRIFVQDADVLISIQCESKGSGNGCC